MLSTIVKSSVSFSRLASTVPISFHKGADHWANVECEIGSNLMREAQKHGVPLAGACEGSCACSTCHVYFDQPHFDLLPEATDREEDMLDFSHEPDVTSRLACQVTVDETMAGAEIDVPLMTRNLVSEEEMMDNL